MIQRMGLVLDLFARDERDMRVGGVAHELGFPRSTAHTVLSSLATIGLLQEVDGWYSVGERVGALAESLHKGLGFWVAAEPEMAAMAAAARETVLLAVLDGPEVIYIDGVRGRHPTGDVTTVPVGTRRPATATAAGRVLLAHTHVRGARSAADARASAAMRARSRAGDDFEAQLDRIRRRGFAEQRGALAADLQCVAAAVRDAQGEAVAALDFSVPANRFASARTGLIAHLIAGADAISQRLGRAPSGADSVSRAGPASS